MLEEFLHETRDPHDSQLLMQIEALRRVLGPFAYNHRAGFKDWLPGTAAGGYHSVFNLSHECAHLIEISSVERVNPFGFMFGYGVEVEIMGRAFNEPYLWKRKWASLREARVFAIQLVILQAAFPAFPVTSYLSYAGDLARYLPAPAHRDRDRDRLGYDASDRRWMIRQVSRLVAKYKVRDLVENFQAKMVALETRKVQAGLT